MENLTWEIGEFIVNMEGRRDDNENLEVYYLDADDGGGEYEVAGINEKYHPEEAKILKELIENKQYKTAENRAIQYIIDYTAVYQPWHTDIRVSVFLRDCRFNRGPTGAAKMLQYALKVAGSYKGEIDGKVGNNTINAAKIHAAEDLIPRLLLSRQWYEREIVKRDETSKYWSGLVNRWINTLQVALSIGNPYSNILNSIPIVIF